MPTPSIIDQFQEALQEADVQRQKLKQLSDDLASVQTYTQVVNQEDGCLYLNGEDV